MKQKDIALIIIIVVVGGVFSFVVSNKFITSSEHDEKASKVSPITAEFGEPDEAYFNDESINPTQLIQIGGDNNESPLKSGD